MREHLLGYLMAALDANETAEVEERLRTDPHLARDCELLKRGLEPLECDRGTYDPPPQLAARTCLFIASRTQVKVAAEVGGRPRRWTFQDAFVTAGTLAAAALLFFPAINFSRFQAQIAGCQNQLRQIGLALSNYSERFAPYLPPVPASGPLSHSGAYAPALVDAQLIGDHSTFICPADNRIQPAAFRVPSRRALETADDAQLSQLRAAMGGSFGTTFGHLEGDKYCFTKDLGRKCFALVTDLPDNANPEHQSSNHGGRGQNTLFEDGHVKFLKTCRCPIDTAGDDIFENDAGTLGPGLHVNDSVIGSGSYGPATVPVSLSR